MIITLTVKLNGLLETNYEADFTFTHSFEYIDRENLLNNIVFFLQMAGYKVNEGEVTIKSF